MKKKVLALVSIALSASLLMTACGKKDNTGSTGDGKLAATQEMNFVASDPSSFDPAQVSDSDSFSVMTNVYESLLREELVDGHYKNVPAAAESFEKSEDGKTYTFHLRKNAKWSDGKEVTAKDFVYGWQRLVDPKNAADYADFIDMVEGAKEVRTGKASLDKLGIKAVDDYTLEVKLAEVCPYFESIVAFKGLAPARQDIVEKLGDKYGSVDDFSGMVFNGPFVISEYQKKSQIVFEKNANYWDAANVKLTKATGQVIDEAAVAVKKFESGELDVVGASGDDLTKLKADAQAGKYQYVTGNDVGSYYFYVNGDNGNKALKSAKVRQALAVTLNREEALNVVYKRLIPSYGIIPAGIQVGDQSYREKAKESDMLGKFIADTKDPKALLVEGLKEAGVDADPSKLTLTMLFGPKNSKSEQLVQYLQKNWADSLGIKIEPNFSANSPSYYDARNKGQFDLCVGGWGADYDDVSTFFSCFVSTSANNSGRYKNAEFDKLVSQAATEKDEVKRLELYKQAEELLVVKDAGAIPFYYSDIHSFRQNRVKGFTIPRFNGKYDLKHAYVVEE